MPTEGILSPVLRVNDGISAAICEIEVSTLGGVSFGEVSDSALIYLQVHMLGRRHPRVTLVMSQHRSRTVKFHFWDS